jgi:CBS domain-containing protein
MSAPAVTIYPEATIPHTAQIMTSHHIRRLPVVGEDGRLIGIVTRRDLLSVFLRPDDEIAERVRELLDDVLPTDPGSVTATVRSGVVILTGHVEAPEDRELIPVAIRLIWDVDGVIDVLNRLGEQADDAAELSEPPAGAALG